MALRVLFPLATYECESTFSTLLTIKTITRNRLCAANDMRVVLVKTKPNLEAQVLEKRQYPSI